MVLSRRLPAFTLIELLIVAVIMMVLIGGGLAGFFNFNDRQEVLNSTKQLQQMIISAQTKVRTGERHPDQDGELCQLLHYYQVELTNSGAGAAMRSACDPVTYDTVQVQSLTFPTGVTASIATAETTPTDIWLIRMRPFQPHQFREYPPSTLVHMDVDAEVVVTSGTYTFSFTVSPNGLVSPITQSTGSDLGM